MLWVDLWPRWLMDTDARGMKHRRALDLDQVRAALSLSGVPRKKRAAIYNDLLEMEDEALDALYAK